MDAAMIARSRRPFVSRAASETGTTLIETLIACALLAITITGLAGMTTMSSTITENQGHLSARTAEYAVDKMEQLLQLTYGDAQSDTTAFPSTTAGGTGLAVGGSSLTTAPVTGYTDYLDADGNLLCPCTAVAPATWQYMRAWQVATPSANLKQITVTATVKSSVGNAIKAQSTVSAYKTNCPAGC
jgi:Tfp pilus assembly protein PilV